MKKPNARERILETAGELFFQRGYSGVGINEIIEKAGTAKASFYQHYPSKENLCEAWLKSMHERSEALRSEILASTATPTEKLKIYFDRLENFLRQGDFRGCPYSNTGALPGETCARIVEQIRLHKESTRAFFREVALLAIADPGRADQVGDRIFVLYSGATGEAQNLRELWPVHSARDAAIEMIT